MPTIQRFDGFKACLYADDETSPHVQVLSAEWEAKIRLDDLTVMVGEIDRRALEVFRRWASEPGTARMLRERWSALNERG
ncbi:DUF4160 domain-containing protein [Methylobacterium planeticum]|uniref:DUF4160 domain-containing protein n=1 Tax=Methylobacterium planeticum TaxID=2615211 RepID=UPI00177A7A8E|nr:DUF4160 domain-containing protein [Methylobacterium planeticum]